MRDVILVINAGSSSVKYAYYDAQGQECLQRGDVQYGHGPQTPERYRETYDKIFHPEMDVNIKAVGHRVVHGGVEFSDAVQINANVLGKLESLIPLAPLHQPHNLMPVKMTWEISPNIPQVACFDTAFHRTQPRINQIFALPRDLTDEGIMRYGFHGLSYEYISTVLPEKTGKAKGRVVVLHLGNGASACAMKDLKSVSSTMGFTAVEGLMMGTRCGAIDPGVLLHLMEQKGMTAKELTELLYKKSGLLGVSGISADTRDLVNNDDPRAKEAIELYCHFIVRAVGQLAADLGGIDVLVFTAGVGTYQPVVRDKVCADLAWLLKDVEVLIIPTDEEKMIARHTARLLG